MNGEPGSESYSSLDGQKDSGDVFCALGFSCFGEKITSGSIRQGSLSSEEPASIMGMDDLPAF